MNTRGIVVGPKHTEKREMAKAMRREMTPAERLLWQRLRGNQCAGMHFRRQQVIDGFIADFYCHAAGLVVEVDGGIHAERHEYDTERDNILTARGLQILRFTNERVQSDIEGALNEISKAKQPDVAEPD